ncbi:MAG: asparagine synthase (glutamine-hydrolyzing), partial [Flavobacteriaceae bacterium]|nr:asparagine synthase (glutamine-hydrolyzing) [Flavobacteriaceae bacterium]
MCGIAGIVGAKQNEQLLHKMLNSQTHRGPDFTGVHLDQDIALGHNRLSIIDLSEAANQPFLDNTGRYAIVFNGEIYNYLELRKELASYYDFRTSSDTEVLLAAYITWGKVCMEKCNGMFSFAIWDKVEKSLLAARDRFGVKPFYYHESSDSFYFSSEIKALQSIGIGKEFNEEVWSGYFSSGSYGNPDETFYNDIKQLPGGHVLYYKEGVLKMKQWYQFIDRVNQIETNLSQQEVQKKYTELLEDSIALRFRADVNIGFNISGGLDSSTLLSFVNKIKQNNIKAFTFYTGDDRYDELPWVKEMITLTQNPLVAVKLTPEEVPALSKFIANIQDEPFGGIPTLAYAKLFDEAKKQGVTVLLDGQGMDEQWAGYDYYKNNNNQVIQGVSKSPFRTNCLHTDFLKLKEKTAYPQPFENRIQNLQYRDLFYTKIPRALRFNDRVSMAFSTELREPFLDYRMVELAFAQPDGHKINNGQSKYLLRSIVSQHLSDAITYAPKRPLQTPQRE